jgi:uncharacterized protein (TIGR02118 family)
VIKLVYCVRKRADISQAEFHRYWLEEHGPRARRHADAIYAARYVQSHTLDTALNEGLRASRGASPPYDGITEMWWTDLETFQKSLGSEAAIAAGVDLLEDERHFIDVEASTLFLTEEHEIF